MATSAVHAKMAKDLPTLLFPADAGARLVAVACAIQGPCGMKWVRKAEGMVAHLNKLIAKIPTLK